MLASQCTIALAISDASQIGEARRCASRFADLAGLDETFRGKAAIIATELATNLVNHATLGELFLRTIDNTGQGIEIVSVDHGPGMSSIAQCLEDGYSSHGTAGNGLGAVRRLSTSFEIQSSQPQGTVIVSQLLTHHPIDVPNHSWSVIERQAPLETACGDAWRIAEHEDAMVLMMVDGLGHGPEAEKAADLAVAAFDQNPFAPLTEIAHRIDRNMRGSRGGALALARLDWKERLLRYVGIGNIAGRMKAMSEASARGLLSHNGTVGVQARKVQEFTYPLASDGLLVMHTDGLQTRWSLDSYPGWPSSHPAAIAGVLYRDHTRGRDDVTVAVVRVRNE